MGLYASARRFLSAGSVCSEVRRNSMRKSALVSSPVPKDEKEQTEVKDILQTKALTW